MTRKLTLGLGAKRIAVGLSALLGAASIAACGGSSSSTSSTSPPSGSAGGATTASSASAPAGQHFTGSPIKLGMINNVGTVDVNVPDEPAAARAAIREVNAAGGIDGHEVQFVFCNEGLNPNTAASCARQMVSDHVMAMVGNEIVTAEATDYAIFKAAGIANVGVITQNGEAGTDPNSYPLYGAQVYSIAANVHEGIAAGLKRIAMAQYQSPITTAFGPVAEGSTKALGGTYVGTVPVPAGTTDVSTQAAALIGLKPQAVLLESSPIAALELVKTMDQLGYSGKFLVGGADWTQSQVESLGADANQVEFVSPFPPPSQTSIKGVAMFEKAVQAEKASGDKAADTSPNVVIYYDEGEWLSVIVTAEIANAAKATTAAAFETAIKAAKDVNTYGMTPPFSPNQTNPKSALPRFTNTSFYSYTWKNNKVSLTSPTPYSVESLIDSSYPKS